MWRKVMTEMRSPHQLWSRIVSRIRRAYRLLKHHDGEKIRTSQILNGIDPAHLPNPPDYVFDGSVEIRNALVIGNGIISKEGGAGIDLHLSLWFGRISDTPVFRKKSARVFEGEDRPAYYLAGCGSFNYYHWLLETLPRLHHIGETSRGARFVVPPLQKFHLETLEFLGINRANSRLVEVHDSEVRRFPHLVVPSPLNHCGMPSQLLHDFWRSAVESHGTDVVRKDEKRIYLSRNDAGTRRVSNENELGTVLHDMNFDLIHCSRLSFVEQVRLFREASVVVGPHGAAMANLIFSNEGTKVLELGTQAYENPCFEHLCASAGIHYEKFLGEAENSGDPGSNYSVDIEKFTAELEGLL